MINLVSMFESNRTKVRRLLMQMALSDDSPSSKAVMHSMLALASLYRDGNQSHAAELKSSAIYALMLSSGKDISAGSALQHVAAAMLLCAYEARSVITCPSLTLLNFHSCETSPKEALFGWGIYAVQKKSSSPSSARIMLKEAIRQ